MSSTYGIASKDSGVADTSTLLNGDASGDETGSNSSSRNSLEEEFETLSLSGDGDEVTCRLCDDEYKLPRVLSCLHVFCEHCLAPLLVDESIICPTCGQVRS